MLSAGEAQVPSLRVALGTGAGSPALMALIFHPQRPDLGRETGHVLRVLGDGAGAVEDSGSHSFN